MFKLPALKDHTFNFSPNFFFSLNNPSSHLQLTLTPSLLPSLLPLTGGVSTCHGSWVELSSFLDYSTRQEGHQMLCVASNIKVSVKNIITCLIKLLSITPSMWSFYSEMRSFSWWLIQEVRRNKFVTSLR